MRFLAGRLDLATRIGPKKCPRKGTPKWNPKPPHRRAGFYAKPFVFIWVFAIPGPLEGTHFENTFGSITGRAKRARKIETVFLGARSAPRKLPMR